MSSKDKEDAELQAAIAASMASSAASAAASMSSKDKEDAELQAAIAASMASSAAPAPEKKQAAPAPDQSSGSHPLDHIYDVNTLTNIMQKYIANFWKLTQNGADQEDIIIANSLIDYVDQRIRVLKGDRVLHSHDMNRVNVYEDDLGSVPNILGENKMEVPIITNHGVNCRVYADGTAATSASIAHSDMRSKVAANEMIKFDETNKCFFIAVLAMNMDLFTGIGIRQTDGSVYTCMSPSMLLMEFRRRHSALIRQGATGRNPIPVIEKNKMVDADSIRMFARVFNCTVSVTTVNYTIMKVLSIDSYGSGPVKLKVCLNMIGKHYPNGAE
jgi:hypothetical protein